MAGNWPWRTQSILMFLLYILGCFVVHGHSDSHAQQDPHLAAVKSEFRQRSKRSVSSCLGTSESRVLQKRAADRRQQLFESLRAERLLKAGRTVRDTATALATDHQSSQMFGSNVSCSLTPEVTVGPYWASGELVRKDLRESQPGVTLYLDLQVIDVKTCKGVPNVYLDIWHCNSTGVYSGVIAAGNGDSSVTSLLNATFLRGLQPTNSDGVAQFTTIFPGHYTGRTNHIHTMAHINGAVLANNTYSSGTIPHIGQIFFDQSLITAVEQLAPYKQNTVQVTGNANDDIFKQESASTSDPVMNWSFLGATLQDGLMGWVTLGIDLTSDQTSQASAHSTLTANGGVDNGNSMGGPGGPGGGCGGPGGNGTGGPGQGGMGQPPPGGMMGQPPPGNFTGMGMPGGNMTGCPTNNPNTGSPSVTPVAGSTAAPVTPGSQPTGTPSATGSSSSPGGNPYYASG